jgi:hypothetical protein
MTSLPQETLKRVAAVLNKLTPRQRKNLDAVASLSESNSGGFFSGTGPGGKPYMRAAGGDDPTFTAIRTKSGDDPLSDYGHSSAAQNSYQIISGRSLQELATQVKQQICFGWICLGGPFNASTGQQNNFAQAMIKLQAGQ